MSVPEPPAVPPEQASIISADVTQFVKSLTPEQLFADAQPTPQTASAEQPVTRYGQRLDFEDYLVGSLEPVLNGQWVRYEAYAALQQSHAAEVKQLKDELAMWRSEHDPCPFSIELENTKAELEKWKQCCGELESLIRESHTYVAVELYEAYLSKAYATLARGAALREGKEAGNG